MENKPTGKINIEEYLKAQNRALTDQGNRIDFMHFIVLAILVVIFVGFAQMFIATGGILIDSWTHKTESYDNLTSKVNSLVEQNNAKVEDKKTIKINDLEQQIKDLKSKNPYLK